MFESVVMVIVKVYFIQKYIKILYFIFKILYSTLLDKNNLKI